MKRSRDEFEDVSMVSRTSQNAKIRGVVNCISPMKKAKTCSFFDGKFTDGKSTMRIFGFDSGVRERLLERSDSPVAINGCEVKRSKYDDFEVGIVINPVLWIRHVTYLQVLVSKCSEISSSNKHFEVTKESVTEQGEKIVMLDEVTKMEAYQRVLCAIKVLEVVEAEEVPGGKKKQDILVSDATGTLRLVLWESEIGQLEEKKSYKLCGVVVREFGGTKFLSTAKKNCKIEVIEDIGVVNNGPEDGFGATSLLNGDTTKEVQLIKIMHVQSSA
jgi:hypothetical protein